MTVEGTGGYRTRQPDTPYPQLVSKFFIHYVYICPRVNENGKGVRISRQEELDLERVVDPGMLE